MIIQCPECKARYRIKPQAVKSSPLQVNCPKCSHKFQVELEPVSGATDNQATILLVDDARFFRELLLDLLKGRDAKLLTAESAENAWIQLQQQRVDLVVVDINLPDKNGLELIRDIRATEAWRAVRILCISGVHRSDEDRQKALQAGADDFISKSFKPEDLNDRIDKLLQK